MARCYSVCVVNRYPSFCEKLPDIWLVSDARNDRTLATALKRLPRGSGFIFRHYHLGQAPRRARFEQLKRIARQRGHCIILAGTPRQARLWSADGVYGPPEKLARGQAMPRLVTAHSPQEIGKAVRARANAILLSPVFPTRSHPGEATLGPVRFHLLASLAEVPVIALGGMNAPRARSHRIKKWAAIDGI